MNGRLLCYETPPKFDNTAKIKWLRCDCGQVEFNGDVTLTTDYSYVDNWYNTGWKFNNVTVTAEGTAVFYNGNEVEASVTGSGVTFVGKCVFNTWGEAAANITAPVSFTKSATVQLANGGTISSYTAADGYEVVVSDSTLYTCQLAASATPAIDLTVATPVTVSGSEVTFAVDKTSLVSGLYYCVKMVDGEGNVTRTTKVQYTGDNFASLDFTAALPASGVFYYTIEASDEQ